MRRVDQKPLIDLEGSAHLHTQSCDGSATLFRPCTQYARFSGEARKCLFKRLECIGRNLDPLQNLSVYVPFDAGGLGAADIKAEYGAHRELLWLLHIAPIHTRYSPWKTQILPFTEVAACRRTPILNLLAENPSEDETRRRRWPRKLCRAGVHLSRIQIEARAAPISQ